MSSLRVVLLAVSMVWLLLAYETFPHRGPELTASRYQTLTMTVEGERMEYLNASYEDPGLYWLVSVVEDGQEDIVYPVQLVLFGTALVLLCSLPLSVAAPAVIAFLIAFQVGVLYWSWDVYWAPALAVLLTMAFLLQLEHSSWVNAASFGVFVGLLGLIRQDAGLIAGAGVLLVALPYIFRPNAKAGILLLWFLVAMLAPKLAFRAHVALSGVEVRGNMEHGIWHNVYMGMGFIENPYGIIWDDTVGAAHARAAGAEFGQPNYQATMGQLVLKLILTDPLFVAKSIAARFAAEVQLIGGLAYSRIGWLALGLVLWPLVLFTKHGWVYATVIGVAMLPPVLTYPSPQYSLGVAMGILASPLFFIWSLRNESATATTR